MRGGRTPGRRWLGVTGYTVLALVSLLVFAATGYAWSSYHQLVSGMVKSGVIDSGPQSPNGDTNILVMGLDSRLDENGDPLPKAIYDQLHAGDSNEGGYNTNVLMLLHVPGDGRKATGISIPRDDYVELPGKPDGIGKGKIKQAYGYAKDQRVQELLAQGVQDKAALEQQSREAGRKETIETVREFLGGVPIDHFVEVTLVGFYDVAKAVEPVTVCLKEDTEDSYSGANFHQGYQQVNAAGALAFVRQRRDYLHPELNFTDLDRERRQQAFIASVAFQLKQAGTFTSPAKLQGLIDAAKKDIVLDSGLDPLAFAQQAQNLTGGNVTFVTLPIKAYGNSPSGEDINLVDVAQVQAKVRELLGLPTPTSDSAAPVVPPDTTVDVHNATNRTGLGGEVEHLLAGKGFQEGTASTDARRLTVSTVYYGGGSPDAANALAAILGGLPVRHDSTLGSSQLLLVIGSDFQLPDAGSSTPPTTTAEASTTPSSEASGPNLTGIVQGGSVPCVK